MNIVTSSYVSLVQVIGWDKIFHYSPERVIFELLRQLAPGSFFPLLFQYNQLSQPELTRIYIPTYRLTIKMKFSTISVVSFVATASVLVNTAHAACPDASTTSYEFTVDTDRDPRRGKTDKKCSLSLLQAKYKNFCNDENADIAADLTLDETAVEELCNGAYEAFDAMPFSDISKYGDQFDNEYYSGGTHWNYEVEDQNGNNNLRSDAYRVKKVYDSDGQRGMIELPVDINSFNPENKATSDLNAAYCCWVQDRQANGAFNLQKAFYHCICHV